MSARKAKARVVAKLVCRARPYRTRFQQAFHRFVTLPLKHPERSGGLFLWPRRHGRYFHAARPAQYFFTSGHANPWGLAENDRRFMVVGGHQA